MHRNTVAAHLDGLRLTSYAKGWRPIAPEFLDVPASVAAKVLATHILRRGESEYLPTLANYAEDLGWPRSRVQTALARAIATGMVREEIRTRRGSWVRKSRHACTKPGTATAQNTVRPAHKIGSGGRTKPSTVPVVPVEPVPPIPTHPNETLTRFMARLPAMDGWELVTEERVRLELREDAHGPSLYACQTAAGIYQSDARARWKLAREATVAGWTPPQAIGLIDRAFRVAVSYTHLTLPTMCVV